MVGCLIKFMDFAAGKALANEQYQPSTSRIYHHRVLVISKVEQTVEK